MYVCICCGFCLKKVCILKNIFKREMEQSSIIVKGYPKTPTPKLLKTAFLYNLP